MIRTMTADRRIIACTAADLLALAPWYVRASDGVYVPRCDLAQYEAGNRAAIVEK